MYREEEFSTATMEPGTLCALMTGIPLEKRLECSVQLQVMILLIMVTHYICNYCMCLFCTFLMYAASALVDYGRGTDPILPLTIHCGSEQNTLSDCSTKELDVGQCTHVAGVDCRGLLSHLSQRVLKSCVHLLQLPVLLKT